VAAEISREGGGGLQNFAVPNVEDPKNPTFIGAWVKKLSTQLPHFMSSQWRHKTSLIATEINRK